MHSTPILLFALLLATALGLDYHLSAYYSVYIGNLEQITVLGDQLGVISSDSVFTLLNGTNYQHPVSRYDCNTGSSNIKVTPQGVFINSGAFVTRRDLTEHWLEFSEGGYWSNMLVHNGMAYVSTADAVPKLERLSLSSMEMREFVYEYQGQSSGLRRQLGFVGQNEMVLGFEKALLILDKANLTLKQVVETKHTIAQISSYFDKKSNAFSTFVGLKRDKQSGGLQWHRLTKSDNQYCTTISFISHLQRNIQLTSPNSAVIVDNDTIHYFQQTDSVVAMDFSPSQSISGKFMALADSEQIFIMENSAGLIKNYQIYQIGADLTVRKGREINIKNSSLGGKGQFTTDDRYLFLKHVEEPHQYLAIVDMATLSFNSTYQNGVVASTILDFYVMPTLSKADYSALYVTVATLADGVYLQLRYGTTQVIDKVRVDAATSYSLLGNSYWDQYLALIKRSATNSTVSLIRAEDYSRIKQVQSVSFSPLHTFHACGSYLIAHAPNNKTIGIYSAVDLTKVKQIQAEVQQFEIQVNKNIMIIRQELLRKNTIYDLTNLTNPLFQRGAFYMEYFINDQLPIFMILARRGLFYHAPAYHQSSSSPSKVFYNISKPALLKAERMQTVQRVRMSPQYFVNSSSNSSCNSVLYTQLQLLQWRIANYSECSKSVSHYPIRSSTPIQSARLFISSDQKYLITIYNLERSKQSKVEVRLLKDLNNVIFDQFFSITDLSYLGDIYEADIANQRTLIVHYYDKVYVVNLHSQIYADSLSLSSFRTYDHDKSNGVIAVAGHSNLNLAYKKLIVMNSGNNQIILNELTTYIAVLVELSPGSEYLGSYHQDFQLKIWSLNSKKAIYSNYFPDIERLKFINQHQLLIQYSSHYSILDINTLMFIPPNLQQPSAYAIHNYEVQINQYGNVSAEITGQQSVFIKTNDSNGTFKAPLKRQTVVSLEFRGSTLLVATEMGTLYELNTGSCAQNFILNQDLNCVCVDPFVLNSGRCEQVDNSFPGCGVGLIIMGILLFIALIVIVKMCYDKKQLKKNKNSLLVSATSRQTN